MPVPDYQSFLLPLLQFASDGIVHSTKESYVAMVDHFSLTENDMSEMLSSGKQAVYKNRIGWAKVYLTKAMLLESPKRGKFHITERGKELLATNPLELNVKHLKNYPEFVEFQSPKSTKREGDKGDSSIGEQAKTPEEIFESSYQEMHKALADDLLDQVMSASPEFFEHLVVRLLVKMGYGGSVKDAGQALGKSGDEGIDGIIKEDKLGLDVIYIQAKDGKAQ